MINIFQVDAFADKQFSGNPAGVCILPKAHAQTDAWMQSLAEEMNLPETAFAEEMDREQYSLRWFTPTTEVKLCGHATLATAHILWSEGIISDGQAIRFATKSGELKVVRSESLISLDFPQQPSSECKEPIGLEMALGCDILNTYKTGEDILVEVKNEEAVRSIAPYIQQLELLDAEYVIVTARGDSVDFVSRVFSPNVGISEDPVTGSTHCSLAPFWAERLNKTQMNALQLSKRGGALQVELVGDRVSIAGHATTVFKGELYE
ncbi:PhzF family phenazine biosynthesis protein [Cocleimonas flava]|uniref:PhzF family phenazine biosynthesis protein n=1 Tax=Cocleimonas flava TaxID=634765 RepID=A0A4R1FEQ2_9GAMM|nr:PhzF family phenazine biosynthesis protein [Cocleimonas flava]TCJ89371.1 PhzF family phenazine biosynthesis protein [Cocleimonas flava]